MYHLVFEILGYHCDWGLQSRDADIYSPGIDSRDLNVNPEIQYNYRNHDQFIIDNTNQGASFTNNPWFSLTHS